MRNFMQSRERLRDLCVLAINDYVWSDIIDKRESSEHINRDCIRRRMPQIA